MLVALMASAIDASAFSPHLLNQMTGWISGETNAVYTYDANGNRQDKFIIVDGTTDATNYEYDEDNRLTKVTVRDTEQPKEYSFAYDYRTRRISRETPTEKTTHVFDGGLSVQEYNVEHASGLLSVENLTTESIRGVGMGGGVGGMVYSVRNGQVEATHSNHRGDVIARTDNTGNLTWFARYNVYGTRFHEFGATYDRQRGNTKDEEKSLELSFQGMRPLGLEHGVWLTPDPIGYGDGPNRYLYVHCNPINAFDPNGLTWNPIVNSWLNNTASRIDNAVVASGRPSGFAAAVSSGLEGMAYSGSATQGKDMFNASVDRTSAVMEQQMGMGESGLKSATVGISALVGDAVGYTPAYEAVVGNDVATQETLSTGERVRRGVQGGSQMLLTGVALKGSLSQSSAKSSGAANNATSTQLKKQLTSESQLSEINHGKSNPLAGAGTDKPLRAGPRLAEQHGGTAKDWTKVGSSTTKQTGAYGTKVETHAYKNIETGKVVEPKTKLFD